MSKMSVQDALWRDIAINTFGKLTIIIQDFITNSEFDKCRMAIIVDDSCFMIYRQDEMKYKVQNDIVNHDVFIKTIESRIYSSKIVCYSITQPYRSNKNETVEQFVKMDYDKIRNLKVDELVRLELVKHRTYTLIIVEKISSNRYILYHEITSLDIAYDSDGDFDEDMYDMALERDPIIEEKIETISVPRILKEIKRITRSIEPDHPLTSGISDYSINKCLMNLTDSKPYNSTTCVRYRPTNDTMEDLRIYTLAQEKSFHTELMEVAWNPDRFQNWCLDEEEIRRIKTYCHA